MGIVVLAVVLNFAFWLLMFLTQTLEVRLGRVPKARAHDPKRYREGFIHIQQYAATSWGDLAALSLVDAIAAVELGDGGLTLTALMVCFLLGGTVGLLLHRTEWMGPYHKPDWAYPSKGKVSWGGRLHLAYFSAQVGVVMALLWTLVRAELSLAELTVFLAGLTLYGLAVWRDMKTRRWAKTPPQRG